MNKIISYIGFAIKSNKVVAGQTPLKRSKENLKLILVCNTATENLTNLAKNLSIKHGCEYIKLNTKLEELSNIKNIKIIGITDENLAKAIIDNKQLIECQKND